MYWIGGRNERKRISSIAFLYGDRRHSGNAVLRDRTLWLTQKAMAGLFGVKSQAITRHLRNIYAPPELTAASTCTKMEQVQNECGRDVLREMVFCNIDAIEAGQVKMPD